MGGTRRQPTYTTSFVPVDHVGLTVPQSLFDGVDLTLGRFTKLSGGNALIAARVAELDKLIQQARAALSPYDAENALPSLIQALGVVRQLRQQFEIPNIPAAARDHALILLSQKEQDFSNAINLAGGVQFTAYADAGEIVPGTSFNVAVSGNVRSMRLIQPGVPQLHAPRGWTVQQIDGTAPAGSGKIEATYKVTVPPDAPVSQPYWLMLPRNKEVFSVAPSPFVGDAVDPALLTARVPLTLIDGQTQLLSDSHRDVVNGYTDRIYGEREQPVAVVPAIGVWVEPAVSVFPAGAKVTRLVRVRVQSNLSTPQSATVRLQLPAGFVSAPVEQALSFKSKDEEFSVRFEVTSPATPLNTTAETLSYMAVVEAGGRKFSTGYTVISYPHVDTRYWFQPAIAKLLRLNVKLAPGLKVGYIMGSGDDVAVGLQQLGVNVTQLAPEDVSYGNLRQYNVIITGIRAFEVRKDLVTSFPRLDEYVKDGGYLLVQYSRPGGLAMPWAPYPVDMGEGPRVSVEEAPVELLVPSHPLFNIPNKISGQDFAGWVQERGTYFMEKWDPHFTPLLSSHDPNEPPQNGGMLVASYGKGMYAYTGYVWFRQLPAGNPGAYRIFANLVSLAATPRLPAPR
jgi:hypothetical protein